MANEVFYSNIGDARLAEQLSAEMDLILADRASLWGDPAIVYAGNAAQSGSTTIKVPIASLDGVDLMSAVAENASVANTAFTVSSTTVTIARQALQREVSDLANLTDSIGLNAMRFIQDGVGGALMRFQELVANVTDDFTSTVGNTTVDMSVDDFFSADFTLTQASNETARIAMLYTTQLTDLQNSTRAEAGAFQFRSDSQGFLDSMGQGNVASFLGKRIFVSSFVPTANAGADSAGAMWARGGVIFADGTPAPIMGGNQTVFPAGTRIMVELSRDASGALNRVTSNYYVGVAKHQDAKGVSIITDR